MYIMIFCLNFMINCYFKQNFVNLTNKIFVINLERRKKLLSKACSIGAQKKIAKCIDCYFKDNPLGFSYY